MSDLIPRPVTDDERRAAVLRARLWSAALDRLTRKKVTKINGQYDKGLITLAELISELAEVHYKAVCQLIDSGEFPDVPAGERQ